MINPATYRWFQNVSEERQRWRQQVSWVMHACCGSDLTWSSPPSAPAAAQSALTHSSKRQLRSFPTINAQYAAKLFSLIRHTDLMLIFLDLDWKGMIFTADWFQIDWMNSLLKFSFVWKQHIDTWLDIHGYNAHKYFGYVQMDMPGSQYFGNHPKINKSWVLLAYKIN